MDIIRHGVYNGIKTTVIEDEKQVMSSASLWFGRGYALDDVGSQGLSHFFEHLWAGGDDAYEKAKILEEYGISSNAYTASYLTYYYHIQEPKYLSKSLELLLNNFDQQSVSIETFNREKKIIAQEKQDSMQNIFRATSGALFAGSALGQDVFGDVEKIGYEQYLEYANNHYSREKAHLVIITPDAAMISLDNLGVVNSLSTGSSLDGILSNNVLVQSIEKNVEVVLDWAVLTPFDYIGCAKMALLRTVLGNFWTSVLVRELRAKRGLVYWVNTDYSDYGLALDLAISYTVDKGGVLESLGVVKEAMQKLDEYMTPQDLERYKIAQISASKQYYSGIQALTEFYGFLLAYPEGIVYTPEDYYRNIDQVSYEDIITLMENLLTSKIKSLGIKGDISNADWRLAQDLI